VLVGEYLPWSDLQKLCTTDPESSKDLAPHLARIHKARTRVTRSPREVKWYFEGLLHRTDGGPARIVYNVSYPSLLRRPIAECWYEHGKLHRTDGPAQITPTEELWMQNGVLHREGGEPAETRRCYDTVVRCPGVYKAWWVRGKLHRENGPAIESLKAHLWYKNGVLHREDGPAVEIYYPRRRSEWWEQGRCHREGGPAVDYEEGKRVEYWEHGRRVQPDPQLFSFMEESEDDREGVCVQTGNLPRVCRRGRRPGSY
jgi:hypothetical protein